VEGRDENVSIAPANLHGGRRNLGPFPPAAPSNPDAPHVTSAEVLVDVADEEGPMTRVWESIGYDEINWTYTPTGKRLLKTFQEFSGHSYYVRPHYVFCSGSGFGIPHWGSGNVYHEDDDGNPYYDFTIADQAYDAIVGAGHHVLVELGFTPRDLVSPEAEHHPFANSPTTYTAYEAGTWAYPPRDYDKWAGLIEALARHCVERYGEEEASSWLWELWNEPDIYYWLGTPEQFNELYAVTAQAIRRVLPHGLVGGPTVTSGGLEFMKGFLEYTSARNEPLDFVSFHTKGSRFPTREYGPIGAPARERLNPSSTKMLFDIRSFNRAIAEFEQYRDLPAIVDECDAAVPAHFGRYDNANYDFQNTEYYPVFQVKLMKKILDLNATEVVSVAQATSWSFYFEGERYFEGTRSFLTAGRIEKPFLNGYRMLSQLGANRVAATSNAAWHVSALDDTDGSSMPEEVDTLASRHEDGTVAVVVWRHTDDQYQTDEAETAVKVTVKGLPDEVYEVSHYRIDADHSNAYTVWKSLNSPQDPTDEELAAIKARQGLEVFEPARSEATADGALSLDVSLPLPSVSLLILRRQS
jgi:xylan 1,4-beta-xylosidase